MKIQNCDRSVVEAETVVLVFNRICSVTGTMTGAEIETGAQAKPEKKAGEEVGGGAVSRKREGRRKRERKRSNKPRRKILKH